MNDDADSDDGLHGGDRDRDRDRVRARGLGRTGLLQNPAFMGEQSADIVIGALQKVCLYILGGFSGRGPP